MGRRIHWAGFDLHTLFGVEAARFGTVLRLHATVLRAASGKSPRFDLALALDDRTSFLLIDSFRRCILFSTPTDDLLSRLTGRSVAGSLASSRRA